MTRFTDDEVVQIFEELPNHQGCSSADLDDAEQAFGAAFPSIYRRLMLLDERRMLSIGWILPVRKLKDWKREAEHLLTEDRHEFQLEPHHVVFAWYDIHSFFFLPPMGVTMSRYIDSIITLAKIIGFQPKRLLPCGNS